MKAVMAISGMMLALVASAAFARGWDGDFTAREPSVKQSGHYEWSWDGKDSLSLEAPVSLHYTPGGAPRIVATGPEELLAHLRVGQGRIRVDDNWHYSGPGRVEVTVTGVTVNSISLSGSGRATLEKLDLDRLNLSISGSGSVKGDGRSDQVSLSISGSGNADLAALTARTASVHISGSGKVDLTPRESASVSVSGSGIMRMTAKPAHYTQSVSGSGGIRINGN